MEDSMVKFSSMLDEFDKRFFDIPFGNSLFQNIKFVVESQYTPGRGYRAIGLKLHDRIEALRQSQFSMMRNEIDIDEIKDKLRMVELGNADNLSSYEIRRLEVDLKEKMSAEITSKKMVNDALVEAAALMKMLKEFPHYTREQFEAEEFQHFHIKLSRQLEGMTGPADGIDIITNNSGAFDSLLAQARELLENKNG